MIKASQNRKTGYRTKPLVITLPDGSPFELKVTHHEWRKMYQHLFRARLGHMHVSKSYLHAIRDCLARPFEHNNRALMWGHKPGPSRWALVKALPREYRRAMLLAVVIEWWKCRELYRNVMERQGERIPKCIAGLVKR